MDVCPHLDIRDTVAYGAEMLGHRKSRNVIAFASQVFTKATPEASSCLTIVQKWTTTARYAIHKILGHLHIVIVPSQSDRIGNVYLGEGKAVISDK